MKRIFSGILMSITLLPIFGAFGDYGEEKKPHRKKWDYIIVGNGTAGAVLARKLSDRNSSDRNSSDSSSENNYENSVLVLEAGFNYDHDQIALDPDATFGTPDATTLSLPPYAFVIPFSVNGGSPTSSATAGKGWGGSSMHNFMTAIRGTPQVYNFWAFFSNDPRWKYDNLLPIIKAVESYYPHASLPNLPLYSVANYHQRGDMGLTSIIQFTVPVADDPFIFSIATNPTVGVGLPVDYNDPTEGTVGISAPQRFNTPYPVRTRSFSSRDYIDAVVDLNGDGIDGRKLKILSGAFVSRVLFRNKTAIGVEYYYETDPTNLITVYAKKIILSAGALHTPGILERSGIGDPAILLPLGIDVIVDNPNVGENLQDHYGRLASMTPGLVPMPIATGFTDLRGQDGYTADGVRRLQMNMSTGAGNSSNNFSGVMLNPKSKGSIHIVSTDPTILPKMNLQAYTDGGTSDFGSDANVIVNYFKYIKQYADDNGRTMISPTPAQYIAGDAALLAYAEASFGFQAHYVGTTRMASSISEGVVNGKLHVFGVKNLMVADIGIEPQSTDGNTAYGAYVIGMTAASILGVDVTEN